MPTATSSGQPPRVRRRITKVQLQNYRNILSELMTAPQFPSHLPPSPPPSRSASPMPSVNGRRKLSLDAPDNHTSKVARTSLQQSDVHQPTRDAPLARKSEEEQPVASTSTTTLPVPVVTAPTPGGPDPSPFVYRRGRPTPSDFIRFHERYSTHGKFLKTSSEQRSQKEPVQSSQNNAHSSVYAAHWQLFSRFEALDALLNFTYAMWCKDMSDGKTHHSLWDTIDLFLKWVRGRWETSETKGALMSTFTGLIRLVEAHIYARKAWHLGIINGSRLDKMMKPLPAEDPASISPATSHGGSSSHSTTAGSVPPTQPLSNGPPQASAATPVSHPSSIPPTVPIPKDFLEALHAEHNCTLRATRAMQAAQMYLNVQTLSKYFPRTFGRITSAQLRYEEEFEVDFEQDDCARPEGSSTATIGGDPAPGPGEGQLWLPTSLTSANGEGIAWVCLLGKSLIREAAYPLGYRGLECIIKKDLNAR